MKKNFVIVGLLFNIVLFCSFFGQENHNNEQEKRIDDLLNRMNLDEKIGQLVQIVGMDQSKENLIRQGKAGSVLMGMPGVEEINRLQKIAVEESRLGIPLLFANDIIHGCHTIFPIPLAGASSWNPDLVTEACRIAAFEAASEGTRWTFAPMVDIARDPRWGRIMEGAGEDPYLGSVFAAAEVKGFQGNSLKDFTSIAACAKHYVAYGGAEGGREYNTVDISERTLREVYLVPFHSAVNNNVASIMSSFNDLNGIPASANYHTLTEILRNEWNWEGVVISDFNAIGEVINHRFAENKREAALKSFKAGVDIDMVGDTIQGDVYAPNLKQLVEAGYISEEEINKSVRHVLRLKFKLGLFEHPYTDIVFFEKNNLSQNYKDSIALRLAEESIVLLKNENHLLPLGKKIKRVALVGPLADNNSDPMGVWAGAGKPEDVITVYQGLKNLLNGKAQIEVMKGCNFNDFDSSGFNDAVTAAKKSDIVIMVVGEEKEMSGEASSKTDLNLPGIQEELIKRIYKTGTPLVVVLMNGRPLTINWTAENVPAIVEAWFPGKQAGNAIARVLLGYYNPSGKLPVTFPRSTGQIPLYYYQKSTGRPFNEENKFTSKYLDSPNTPLFSFGYGLSYTEFKYKDIKILKNNISENDSNRVSVEVENTGDYEGEEVVQLYLRDEFASVTRPVKELKGFQKIVLKPGKTKKVEFDIVPEMLFFLDKDMNQVVEPGKFIVLIGGNSEELIETSFNVTGGK